MQPRFHSIVIVGRQSTAIVVRWEAGGQIDEEHKILWRSITYHDSLLATNWPMAYLDIGGGCGSKLERI